MRISESEQNCTTPKSRNSESEPPQLQNITGENFNSTSRRNSKNLEKRKSVLKENVETVEVTKSKEVKSDTKVPEKAKELQNEPKKPKSDTKVNEPQKDQKSQKGLENPTEPKVNEKEVKRDTKISQSKSESLDRKESKKSESQRSPTEKVPQITEIMTNPDQALAKSDSGFSEKVLVDDEVDDAPLPKKEELSLEKAQTLYDKRVRAAAFFQDDFDDYDDLDDDDEDSVMNGTLLWCHVSNL